MMIFLAVLFGLIAVAVGLDGMGSLTQATLGVGTLAGACLLAVFARLFQASAHHSEVMQALRAAQKSGAADTPAATPSPAPEAGLLRCANCGSVSMRGPATCPVCDASLKDAPPA